jgi:fucose permease
MEFHLNTEERGAPEAWAGSLSVLFWASLTVGRFLMGILIARFGLRRLLTFSLGSALVGATLDDFSFVAIDSAALWPEDFAATLFPNSTTLVSHSGCFLNEKSRPVMSERSPELRAQQHCRE